MMTRNSLFVDTSAWAALADRRQPEHGAMQAIYQQVLQHHRRLLTTNYVLAEVVPLLDQRLHFPRPDIFSFVRVIQSAPFVDIVHIMPDSDADAWNMLEQYTDKAWSLVDATSFVIMRQLGLTEALTTDQHFTQAGFIRPP